MISGMTGFGAVEKTVSGVKFVVEMKSQNHRYLDIVFYLPPGFSAVENKIREILGKQMQRGRVTVSLKIVEKKREHMFFNKELVKEYLKCAQEIQKKHGLVNNLGVSEIFRLPGVFETKETHVSVDDIFTDIQNAINGSLKSLLIMRQREGRSLAVDFRGILRRMLLQIKKIETRSKKMLDDRKKEYSAEELLSYQKGSDINEELVRLAHYIEEFKLLLNASSGVGKKLDFVAQEMQRETNTIGSKVQDKIVSNAVIALKSKIEKLRELAQNVE